MDQTNYSKAYKELDTTMNEISEFMWDEAESRSSTGKDAAHVYQEELASSFAEVMKSWLATPKFFSIRDQESIATRCKKMYMDLEKVIRGTWSTR